MEYKEKLQQIIDRIDGEHFDLHESQLPFTDKTGLINMALDQISTGLEYLEKAAALMEDQQ